jgi:hypothetical protein
VDSLRAPIALDRASPFRPRESPGSGDDLSPALAATLGVARWERWQTRHLVNMNGRKTYAQRRRSSTARIPSSGFVGLFADDGVINLGHAGVEPLGLETYRGDKLGDLVVSVATYFPDIHRELHRVNVLGDLVAVELSIQGTFLGPLQTPSGTFEPTGAKVDGPCADFWYLRDGKIERFDCYIMFDTMRAQMGLS